MGDAIRVSGPINADGLELTIETGKLASLADGAVVLTVGDTVVLSTVATSKPREGIDFFPLTVDVEERMYAAGKIPGSFFRREGRPGEAAILTCRLTDRPLRPSFPEGFRDETQLRACRHEPVLAVSRAGKPVSRDVRSSGWRSAASPASGTPCGGT
jgi:polyribonucleotide nucleotidyltransferase